MALLPSMGCTHIVTVQGSREKAEIVGESAKTHGMEWINIPLDNAQPLNYTQIESMLEKLKLICEAIESGGHVLIHCAAGLHRTGVSSLAPEFVSGILSVVKNRRDVENQERKNGLYLFHTISHS
eukprot:TRINITY_DN2009_c0_g1_i3.p1 TRINITY_DN2009_c0_g1~~TRINITY_DN2009_c0_g1_i3.p1  ORF type:complete len:125 (-),score=19.97 TRINITY_DN2009_c0_g1_i3:342-716(-)